MRVNYFSFKTSAFFLDDNEVFLQSIEEAFARSFPLQTATRAQTLLQAVENQGPSLTHCAMQIQENSEEQESVVSLDLGRLSRVVMRAPDRNLISVVFVDYSMPSENGLAVLEKITNPFVKKVLLTGEYDDQHAIEALNFKKIDGYINKKVFDIGKSITELMETLSKAYMQDLNRCVGDFVHHNEALRALYSHPEYGRYIDAMETRHGAQASCLYDPAGSRLIRIPSGYMRVNVYEQEECDQVVMPTLGLEHPLYGALAARTGLIDYKREGDLTLPAPEDCHHFYCEDFHCIQVGDQCFYLTVSLPERAIA